MAEPRSPKSIEELLAEAEETITGIVRKKFRVSLSQTDGRRENEAALDLCQEVRLLLVEKLIQADNEPIRNVRDYAAVLTYHRCAQHRRAANPAWHSLKNSVRYFLENLPGYAVWNNDEGELFCGFVSQKNRRKSPQANARLEELYAQTRRLLPDAITGKALETLKRRDWEVLFDTIFKHLESPVELDEAVSLIAELFGVKEMRQADDLRYREENEPPPLTPDDKPTPEMLEMQRQFLRRLWEEICQLRPNQRLAYLLNFRDGDGDVQLFIYHGVTSKEQLGAALNLSDEQFARLWEALPLSAEEQARLRSLNHYNDKFAALFVYIPLEDLVIAKVIGGERQQVINLRRLARDRLARQLADFR